MLSEIYAINNYKIELELVFNQINVKMTYYFTRKI